MAKTKEALTADGIFQNLVENKLSFDERFKLFNLLKNDLVTEAAHLKQTGEKASNVLQAITSTH